MSPLQITVLVFTMVAVYAGGPEQRTKSCEQFTKGSTFNDSQAIGTWYLMTDKRAPDLECLQFYAVNEEERNDVSRNIGKYVTNATWEYVTLMLQIPCSNVPSKRRRTYFLENRGKGYYHSIRIPSNPINLTPSSFSRNWMSLQYVDSGNYLIMMDCSEKFIFLMHSNPNKHIDDQTIKLIEDYWDLE